MFAFYSEIIEKDDITDELKEVTLQRTLLSKYGVRGVMYYKNKRIAHTLENPWLNNQPNLLHPNWKV